MKIRNLRTNYLLTILRILSSALVGVFTMPYINRVLGPESLGKVEYVYTIVNYFVLFSALGIPMYGIRQISKVRDIPDQLSKTIVEILIILFSTTVIAYVLIFGILKFSFFFNDYSFLIIIMSSMILLNNLGVEWFFQGIEDQMYMTIRYLVVRFITVVLLFLFVDSPDDYLNYAGIVVLNFGGSNVLNFFRIRKYVQLNTISLKKLQFRKHLRPSLTIFLASISVSIYLQIDNFLLGFMTGDKYVGYYSASNKLLRYVITFITAIGAIMLPRLSKVWNEDKDLYTTYLQKTLAFLLLISIPCSIYFLFFSDSIIYFMAGDQYTESVLTLKILAPTCILVGLAYFFGFLVLYTQNKERIYTIAVALSAVISIAVNIILIKHFKHNGAAITQVISEMLGLSFMVFYISKFNILDRIIFSKIKKVVFAGLIFFIVNFVVSLLFEPYLLYNVIYFVTMTIVFWIFYLIILVLLKEEICIQTLYSLKNSIQKLFK